jgi:N-acetylmuramoyl-L-alanine amidase
MKITDHRLKKGAFVQAHAFGGALANPTLIVLHDTANRAQPGETVRWFSSAACKTSAHFVVERDGSITQMVECSRKAFHAGQSNFNGRGFCNGFAIGIEIDNPGKLDKNGRAWFHKKGEAGYDGIEPRTTKEHGAGYWLPYTPQQVKAVTDLCKALVAAYPSIKDIATHWIISPGRKIDTNPLFPLKQVQAAVFGHAPTEREKISVAAAVSAAAQSQTVRMQIAAPFVLLAGYISDGGQWLMDVIMGLVAQLPGLGNDIEGALGTAQQFSTWLDLPFAKISLGIVFAFSAFTIYRHVRDKLNWGQT